MSVPRNSVRLSRSTRRGELAFNVRKLLDDGVAQTIVSVICAKCGTEHAEFWTTGLRPEYIKKRWQVLGWEFDPFQKRACICPHCSKRGKTVAQAANDKVVNLKQEPAKPDPLAFEPPAATASLLRPLTPDEKARVRRLLDGNFDDTKCRYLEGYSDKRIGEEANIPWAAVQQLRELAYGPLKDDEKLLEMRAAITALKGQVDKTREGLEASFKMWDQRVAALEAKIKEL